MPKKTDNKKLITSFFNGELPEDERFKFEQEFIANADLFDEVKAFEDDLIERYVRGWMDPAQRSAFEQKFLTTNKRRERVEFSHAFIEKIGELSKPAPDVVVQSETSDAETTWHKIAAFLFSPKIVLTAAALVVAAVFGSWVAYQNVSDRGVEIVKNPDPSATSGETPESAFTPSPAKSPDKIKPENKEQSEDITEDVAGDSNESDEKTVEAPAATPKPDKDVPKVEKTPSKGVPPRSVKPPVNPVIALFPGIVRSGGDINELSLPKGSKGASIILNIENTDYKRFSARLTDPDGKALYQRNSLRPKGTKIRIFVPANSLKRGDYIIKLSGENSEGINESVADFQFRVKE